MSPLFVSHRRLIRRKTLPRAVAPWALDSGGFSELSLYGEWRTSPKDYITAVRRYGEEIGHLAWAAPQDHMCEPGMLAKTGRTVLDHQKATVASYLELTGLWNAPWPCPIKPVVQGWKVRDYLRCVDLYATAGVDLSACSVVGLGSVCRRQATGEIGEIVQVIRERAPGISLHGFGVKLRGLALYGDLLTSSDSMAWSFDARRADPLPGCQHSSCSNCLTYALKWRGKALAAEGSSPRLW